MTAQRLTPEILAGQNTLFRRRRTASPVSRMRRYEIILPAHHVPLGGQVQFTMDLTMTPMGTPGMWKAHWRTPAGYIDIECASVYGPDIDAAITEAEARLAQAATAVIGAY